MITELNIYISLVLAFLLLALSVRLGVSLYQVK
jgi:Photosystem I protein M (PsaM)